ncbi:TetR/AcrR family transcriptional regulator C-terminal domain-containing protein [Gordonia polyisoprenivorans]|nr:TetR/AcrR family transcriptional regulator C-terminal domain-containing protein [Gordonia polyisoprenivorans]
MEAAVAVIRAEGLDALSMRRLSRELGRSQMAVYSYVADKQALLDLVARATLADVEIPDTGTWDVRLRALIDNIDRRLRKQPDSAGLLLQRMLHSHQHIVDAMMEIMLSAGLPERQVLLAYAMIHTYLFGRYQVTVAVENKDDAELPPTLARVTAHLDELHGADYYSFGIDSLIDGLRARIRDAATEAGQE